MDVFGLGQCCVDLIGTADTVPVRDEKCELREILIDGGGPVATAFVALQRWGHHCAFAGIIGDDSWGGEIQKSLAAEGIDCTDLIERPGSVSQLAFIVAEPGAGKRTIFWRRPSGLPLAPAEITRRNFENARLFYADGLMIDAALDLAESAKTTGIPVLVDAGTLREGMLELAARSDYFIASEKFGRALIGGDEPEAACRELSEYGPAVTAVTLGPKGYVACINGTILTGSAYPVEAVDTTGCGDIFHAGFAHGLLLNWDIDRCLDFGAWAAAQSARHCGGRAGIPDANDYPGTPPEAG